MQFQCHIPFTSIVVKHRFFRITQVATKTPAITAEPVGLEVIAAEFEGRQGAQERVQLLLEYAKRLPPMPASAKTDANRVMGCTAQVIAGDACAMMSSALLQAPGIPVP